MNIDINALLGSAARRLAGPDETLAAGEAGHFAQLLAGLTDNAPLLPESLLPVQPGEEIPGELLAEVVAADDQSTLPPVIGADDKSALPEIVLLTPDAVVPAPLLPAQPALPDGWQLQQLVAQNAGADAQDAPLLREVTADVRPSRSPVPRPPLPLDQAANAVAETLPASLPQLGALAVNTTKPLVVSPEREALLPLDSRSTSDAPLMAAPRPVLTAITLPAPAAPPVVVNPHPVGTPAWQQSLGQQLAIFSRDGVDNAQIKLHPEELGALQITLRMQQNQAELHIVSEHPQVRQALEAAMPQLRSALAETGVQLGQTSVSADNPHFAGAQAQGNGSSGHGHARQGSAEPLLEEENSQPIALHHLSSAAGINTFA
ncbi:flagellar hook-length control protein FliK [Erwinia aphidicola]|uniref:flagellar hook-length control protein FliK n=1 Tax=Erwinia aphidicola TaxID=68334 RepID=UPI00209CA9E4|nr:flagellar hook-length control protein FliK [Erwinia aphidicola]MCP2230224.1 hypothetical protein [Erwinia aphidicola]